MVVAPVAGASGGKAVIFDFCFSHREQGFAQMSEEEAGEMVVASRRRQAPPARVTKRVIQLMNRFNKIYAAVLRLPVLGIGHRGNMERSLSGMLRGGGEKGGYCFHQLPHAA